MNTNSSFENNSDIKNDNILKKSKSHIITWKKNSNVNTCDLSPNCIKLEIDIKKNKNINFADNSNIIINPDKLIIDILPTGNLKLYESFETISYNDNILLLTLIILLLFVLVYKKNNFSFN